jgi:peptidylprolyl isomerase
MRRSPFYLVGALTIAMTASASAADSFVTAPSGLQYKDTVAGTGPQPKAGQTVNVHYTGWLYQDGQKGAKFSGCLRSAPARSSRAGTRACRP